MKSKDTLSELLRRKAQGMKLAVAAFRAVDPEITARKIELLLALYMDPECPREHLFKTCNVSPMTCSRNLEKLWDQGLINQRPNQADAKRTDSKLTPAGEEIVEAVLAMI